jgi:hypothetical protein
LVFTSEVYPDCPDDACNKKRLDEEKASKVTARIYTSLLYRHWNRWQGQRRSHLFAIGVDGSGLKDLTPGPREVPPFSLGGPDDYAISPDRQNSASCDHRSEPAVSTNSDLYVAPMAGPPTRLRPTWGRQLAVFANGGNSPITQLRRLRGRPLGVDGRGTLHRRGAHSY